MLFNLNRFGRYGYRLVFAIKFDFPSYFSGDPKTAEYYSDGRRHFLKAELIS